jgi:hypothetical protein
VVVNKNACWSRTRTNLELSRRIEPLTLPTKREKFPDPYKYCIRLTYTYLVRFITPLLAQASRTTNPTGRFEKEKVVTGIGGMTISAMAPVSRALSTSRARLRQCGQWTLGMGTTATALVSLPLLKVNNELKIYRRQYLEGIRVDASCRRWHCCFFPNRKFKTRVSVNEYRVMNLTSIRNADKYAYLP